MITVRVRLGAWLLTASVALARLACRVIPAGGPQ